jgi:hypothetical protein
VRSTEHKALRYVVFSTPLLPHPSRAQIFSSAPYLQKALAVEDNTITNAVLISIPFSDTIFDYENSIFCTTGNGVMADGRVLPPP